MVLRKIIIKKDDFSVDCEALKVFRKYRCHPVVPSSMNRRFHVIVGFTGEEPCLVREPEHEEVEEAHRQAHQVAPPHNSYPLNRYQLIR
jgi:hypothetical protein